MDNIRELENKIAYCGLLCYLCAPDSSCNCKTGNHCGKRESEGGCHQYDCCREKNIQGCWECNDSPCGIDMMAEHMIKVRAFVRCIKEDGVEQFLKYIDKNEKNGFIYHRIGIYGDYDLESEEAILKLLRTGTA